MKNVLKLPEGPYKKRATRNLEDRSEGQIAGAITDDNVLTVSPCKGI
jgi:hypothetical protein